MDESSQETTDKLIKKKRNQILRRIKKHFGIIRRDSKSSSNQNNLPPLQFHSVHGDNIRISRDGKLARRFESFCRALTFSARPICINERIYVRFSEVSNNWNGGIRFGFTSIDPAALESSLPKYACPDLTNRPGYWAKALHEQYCELDNVLHYYVNSAGDVIYGINEEEKGVILSGIDVRGLLWAIIDVYGNCTTVELIDAQLFNRRSSVNFQRNQRLYSANSVFRIETSMQSMSVFDAEVNLPPLKYHVGSQVAPLSFHTLKGRNIKISVDHLIATRAETDFCQGYVFTARPIQIDEHIVIQILKTDYAYVGALSIGLTSCNPATLNQRELPDDSTLLLDRPEYWVVKKDIGMMCEKNDEISFCISSTGEVKITKNLEIVIDVIHVDQRLRLWAFLDIYGSTQSVRMFWHPTLPIDSIVSQHCFSTPDFGDKVVSTPIHKSREPTANFSQHPQKVVSEIRQIMLPSCSKVVQIQPHGTVLLVNLPQVASRVSGIEQRDDALNRTDQTSCLSLNTSIFSSQIEKKIPEPNIEQNISETELAGSECTICYEKNIDSALYMCGHMCMCFECAMEQWRGTGGGHCPLCRALIRDVIRTYTT